MCRYMKSLLGLLFFSVQTVYALPLQGNTLYMCSDQSNSKLYVLNYVNGAKTLVGSMGTQCTDLAFAGTKLQGVSFTRFLTLNPTTGAVTASKRHGFTDINALVAGPTAGTFYAAGFTNNSGQGANFIRINGATGVGTKVGKFGAGLTSAGDLVFYRLPGVKYPSQTSMGSLFATVNKPGSPTTWLAQINTTTGKATLKGNIGHKNVWGLAVRKGEMYAVTNDGKLLRIDNISPFNYEHIKTVLLGRNGIVQAGLAKSPDVYVTTLPTTPPK